MCVFSYVYRDPWGYSGWILVTPSSRDCAIGIGEGCDVMMAHNVVVIYSSSNAVRFKTILLIVVGGHTHYSWKHILRNPYFVI